MKSGNTPGLSETGGGLCGFTAGNAPDTGEGEGTGNGVNAYIEIGIVTGPALKVYKVAV